jgi:hypothetical protein
MIVSIHQPHFLPWMGYLNKVWHSDVFVWLHTVQYRKNYFQNRTRIKNENEQPLWLTLPVHARLGMPIDNVIIADSHWKDRVQKNVEQCYRRTPFFDAIWPALHDCMQELSDNLDEVNFQLFNTILCLLDCRHVTIKRVVEIPIDSENPTERLVKICSFLGAEKYIAGRGGRNYMQVELFERAGVEIVWQAFDPQTITYAQTGKTFLPGLSIIDCLFNVGPLKTRHLIEAAWRPE